MLHLAALKLDFAPALNHAVRRASVPVSVIRPVPLSPCPVPRCAPLCFVGSGNADKRLFMKDNRSDNGQARLAKIFLFPVIGTITGAAGPFRRDHDSFVTRRSGCRHRANRIAKRASASGIFRSDMTPSPIFYDASGRRRRRFALGVAAFVALLLISVIALVVSIGAVPRPPLLPFAAEHPAATRLPPPRASLLTRAQRNVRAYARFLTGAPARGVHEDTQVAIGFHVPWDPSSSASLRRHIGELDWLVPGARSSTAPNTRR